MSMLVGTPGEAKAMLVPPIWLVARPYKIQVVGDSLGVAGARVERGRGVEHGGRESARERVLVMDVLAEACACLSCVWAHRHLCPAPPPSLPACALCMLGKQCCRAELCCSSTPVTDMHSAHAACVVAAL